MNTGPKPKFKAEEARDMKQRSLLHFRTSSPFLSYWLFADLYSYGAVSPALSWPVIFRFSLPLHLYMFPLPYHIFPYQSFNLLSFDSFSPPFTLALLDLSSTSRNSAHNSMRVVINHHAPNRCIIIITIDDLHSNAKHAEFCMLDDLWAHMYR